jgi:hypothetical protein
LKIARPWGFKRCDSGFEARLRYICSHAFLLVALILKYFMVGEQWRVIVITVFGFHKRWRIYLLFDWLLAFQEGLSAVELFRNQKQG